MNISKNSRTPTFYEEKTVNDAMVLRSGKKINIASSTPFGHDVLAITDLFQNSPCLRWDCGYGMYADQYGITIYGGKKQIVEAHQERMRKRGLSQWGGSFSDGRNQPKVPKYMLEIMKQEFCSSCLRSDLILGFISRYKKVFRFIRSKPLREMSFSKLDEVITHCNKNADNGYTCSSCEIRQEQMRLKIYQGPTTRNRTRSGGNIIEQAVLASMTKRNNFETVEKAKNLKKYISTPHTEVQTAYFKLGSILPGDCVKAVFSFL